MATNTPRKSLVRRLHRIVQRDVKSATKDWRADRENLGFRQIEFHCSDVNRRYFEVEVAPIIKHDPQFNGVRTFELESRDKRITVRKGREKNNVLHTARPALYPAHHCLLDVNGYERPMRLWQFSKLVLEEIFFLR